MNTFHCDACRHSLSDAEAVPSVAGKAVGTLAGLALGASARNPWVVLGLAVFGAAVGHWIDTEVTPSCPLCGAVLHAIVPIVLG